jgi:cytochrome c oxidase subunit 3
MMTGAVMYFHNYLYGSFLCFIGLFFVVLFKFSWFKDVTREGTFLGNHTLVVQQGLRFGFILFVVSELMFFFAFFWAFFHSALAPTYQIDAIWPPYGLHNLIFNFLEVPLINTFILLLSGATITWAHHSLIKGYFLDTVYAFTYTIVLALFFISFQAYEYYEALFTIADGIYGSTFFVATGFHGLHVIIGSIFILVCFYRFINCHYSRVHHLGFEMSCWYWHFVDVVWLFLVICIYIWGNTI